MLGQSGAVALLIVLFMAVTSCASAELIAVSSILTFDIYKMYIKPHATGEQLIFVSHAMICVFGVTMSIFAVIWNVVGIDLGWLFLVMGLIIGGAVFPTAFAITWRGQTKAAAISAPIVGLIAAIIAWLVTAKQYFGAVTVATTGTEYATLAGNLAAIMTGLIVSVAVSLLFPDKVPFDWETTRSINAKVITAPNTADVSPQLELVDEVEKKATSAPPTEAALPTESVRDMEESPKEAAADLELEEEPRKLASAFILACWSAFILTFIMDFLVPMPMFFSQYIFSKGFFTAWVVISFIWVFVSGFISAILPIWEVRGFLGKLGGSIWRDVFRKSAKA